MKISYQYSDCPKFTSYHILGELGSGNQACYTCKGHCYQDSIIHSSHCRDGNSLGLREAPSLYKTHHLHKEWDVTLDRDDLSKKKHFVV